MYRFCWQEGAADDDLFQSASEQKKSAYITKTNTDFGGDRALQTTTSFNPRQLHHYHFEGEPSVTFSIKELKVGREMQETQVIPHCKYAVVRYIGTRTLFTRDACDSSLQICAHGSGRTKIVIELEQC